MLGVIQAGVFVLIQNSEQLLSRINLFMIYVDSYLSKIDGNAIVYNS
jgi:hypothetical protein